MADGGLCNGIGCRAPRRRCGAQAAAVSSAHRDAAGADDRGDLDVLGPVDGEDVGTTGVLAVDSDDVDAAAAGAERP